ncbi:unnamed protein product [Diamesa serratosioi]
MTHSRYWQNSKFRSDFTDQLQSVIRSSRMLSKFTATEIEKSIFNAFQHDYDEYFQQIYDLSIYINQHKNYENLTQDVINNPTKALIKLKGYASNFALERKQREIKAQQLAAEKLAKLKKDLEDNLNELKRIKKLEEKSCSPICYKEFKKICKILQMIPSNDTDCKMCMNRFFMVVPANAVFYSCGHNFLCIDCANSYWNKGNSCGCKGCLVNTKVVCPICNVPIKDVIKSYSPF